MKLSPPEAVEFELVWIWKEKVVLKEAGEWELGSKRRIGEE